MLFALKKLRTVSTHIIVTGNISSVPKGRDEGYAAPLSEILRKLINYFIDLYANRYKSIK